MAVPAPSAPALATAVSGGEGAAARARWRGRWLPGPPSPSSTSLPHHAPSARPCRASSACVGVGLFSPMPPPGGWPLALSPETEGDDVANRGLPSTCAPVIPHEPASTTTPPSASPPPPRPFPAAATEGPMPIWWAATAHHTIGPPRLLHRQGDGTPHFFHPTPSVGTAAAWGICFRRP
ncbi:Os01g0815000 [Oryza sativa Japonica Group]|uniref:Os01g0815000 protein n=1 Tax=Oryza sativa subsp. japonica TaxID=39947 RepID=A0A0N7KDY5_ORYSJ|nr:Os01g0815000 [Oryza sativa Japonica Group]